MTGCGAIFRYIQVTCTAIFRYLEVTCTAIFRYLQVTYTAIFRYIHVTCAAICLEHPPCQVHPGKLPMPVPTNLCGVNTPIYQCKVLII